MPVGVPEVIRPGKDLTLVTYGAACKVAMNAAGLLDEAGIDTEVIDVRSLLPFDRAGIIGESLRKTNRLVVVDEDVPGGTSAFILQQVLEHQDGYYLLDSEPVTHTAKAHRPAYGTDGNYWSKPNEESIFETVYRLMNEVNPGKFPIFF